MSEHPTTEAIKEAVASGLAAALERPETWQAAMRGMRASTEKEAGRAALGLLTSAFRKILLFVLAGVAVYLAGGWSAVVALFKASH